MGDALYAQLNEDKPTLAYRTYAPVGSHRDLLAYLVRRLLENGANSSFVAQASDDAIPIKTLLERPESSHRVRGATRACPICRGRGDLFLPRINSRGVEFGDRTALDALLQSVARETASLPARRVRSKL